MRYGNKCQFMHDQFISSLHIPLWCPKSPIFLRERRNMVVCSFLFRLNLLVHLICGVSILSILFYNHLTFFFSPTPLFLLFSNWAPVQGVHHAARAGFSTMDISRCISGPRRALPPHPPCSGRWASASQSTLNTGLTILCCKGGPTLATSIRWRAWSSKRPAEHPFKIGGC